MTTSTSRSLVLLMVLLLLHQAPSLMAQGITYNPTADFSITEGNPNGVWSYGWMPVGFGALELFTETRLGVFGSPQWWSGWNEDFTPSIWKNAGSTTYSGVPPGLLSLHPGPNQEPVVLRWTAPTTDSVRLEGLFFVGDRGTMRVAVRLNDQPWWGAIDSGAFLLQTNVVAGDRIDFTVYGGYAYGNTPLMVFISTAPEPFIRSQPASQNAMVGQGVSLGVEAGGAEPLHYQWYFNDTVLAEATNAQYELSDVQLVQAGNYRVVASNAYGSVTSQVAELSVNAALLDAFNPGADARVYALAVQTDGKVVVGGYFSMLGGQPRGHIARLNPDGSPDSTFNPDANDYVYCLALQPDGKILVGGRFTSMGGQPRNYLARLNPDGSLDRAFDPNANNYVRALVVQPDGKILAGGQFTSLGGQPRNRIARLNADGSLDSTFYSDANSIVFSLVVQPDGKVWAGGAFNRLGGQPRNCIGRLNADGSLDSAFYSDANEAVHCLALEADGKVLAGGTFTSLGGQPRNRMVRLNADGSLDASFDPNANDWVRTLAVQTDGKMVVGGTFTSLGGQPRHGMARLNTDGSLDSTFNPDANDYVYSVVLQPDGEVLVGGEFTVLGGQPRNYLARLTATDPATQNLTWDGQDITWLRGGSSPEVWRTTFEVTTNGSDWTHLGAGERIPGGWQLASVTLPDNPTVRARGYTFSGYCSGSSWFVETVLGPPLIAVQPVTQMHVISSDVSLSVQAVGGAPLSYQWYVGNMELIPWATGSTLTLSNAQTALAGDYQVVVSNAQGSITSSVARVTFIPVLAWGANTFGQTVLSPELSGVVAIAAGDNHNLALKQDGTLISWKFPLFGLKVIPAAATNVTAIAAGAQHNLVLREDGTVIAWGNQEGAAVPEGLSDVSAVAAGSWHNLALLSNGTVVAWGRDAAGQATVPEGLTHVTGIAAGHDHSLALKSDGTVVAWGDNTYGQTDIPEGLTNVIALAGGEYHSLALRTDGTAVAWGRNDMGQTDVPEGLSHITAIAAGGSHNLALKADGTMVAWGSDSSGQATVPSVLQNVIAIAGGLSHSLALVGEAVAVPKLANPVLLGTTFTVRIYGTPGKTYVLEGKDSLGHPEWTALDSVAGLGAMQSLTDTNAPPSQRFYQVRIQ